MATEQIAYWQGSIIMLEEKECEEQISFLTLYQSSVSILLTVSRIPRAREAFTKCLGMAEFKEKENLTSVISFIETMSV